MKNKGVVNFLLLEVALNTREDDNKNLKTHAYLNLLLLTNLVVAKSNTNTFKNQINIFIHSDLRFSLL